MNNEPVAWMFEKDGAYMCIKHDNKVNYDGGIPLYIHPAKELHLSLQKSKETGELLAVTYTDDEHRIVEVLWQKPEPKPNIEKFFILEANPILGLRLNEIAGFKKQLHEDWIRVVFDGETFKMKFAEVLK